MHNVVKWPNILLQSCGVNSTRFLKYVWPFYNIMHERVKEILWIIVGEWREIHGIVYKQNGWKDVRARHTCVYPGLNRNVLAKASIFLVFKQIKQVKTEPYIHFKPFLHLICDAFFVVLCTIYRDIKLKFFIKENKSRNINRGIPFNKQRKVFSLLPYFS